MSVPLLDLSAQYRPIRGEINKAIDSVLDSQQFILGPAVEQCEKEIANACGVSHAIGVASGSDALLLALMALGISAEDEVITTPYTFFATGGAIARISAKAVFVDIDPATYNMDPNQIEAKITSKTRAIMPVHLYGQCADMDAILEIANRHGLPVIEDAAQAIGSTYKGKHAGAIGAMGCFSFFPSKNLGAAGDGGMVTTNDAELAEKIRVLRVHGSKPKYYHSFLGINSRLDSIQAAILSVKLPYLAQWSQKRVENAQFYNEQFNKIKSVVTPYIAPYNQTIYNQYVLRVPHRDMLIAHLKKNGIGCEIYYPVPLHLQPCFSEWNGKEGDFLESEKAARETIALPIYSELTLDQKMEVAEAVINFISSI
ncbi:MAG: DegT/DnrJ/EryC1/StrS family aminotransferase [Nitrospirota bacterium]